MLFRWVSRYIRINLPYKIKVQRSLVRTAPLVLLMLSVIPLLLIGSLNNLRTRNLLQKQISIQLGNISSSAVHQIGEHISLREKVLDQLVSDEGFNNQLTALFSAEPGSTAYSNAKKLLFSSFIASPRVSVDPFYDEMFLVNLDGEVLLSTDNRWPDSSYGGKPIDNSIILSLIGSNRSILSYQPESGYGQNLTLFTSRTFVDQNGNVLATMVATSSTDLSIRMLESARSFLPGTNSYFFTENTTLIDLGDESNSLKRVQDENLSTSLIPLIGEQHTKSQFLSPSPKTPGLIAFAEWLPEYQIGILLAVPRQIVLDQARFVDPLNLLLLVGALIISGSILYYASSQLVKPLLQLAKSADNFSKGDWSERAQIQRDDEIGLLANSFNHMADELSVIYQSLESVVEKRTSQLRIASEVASLATATTGHSGTLSNMVRLIAERFGLYYVAVFMIDEPGRSLVLREAAGSAPVDLIKNRGARYDTGSASLISWVARYNQSRTALIDMDDPLFQPDNLLSKTRSEVAIPIASSGHVVGILDIHSDQENAFDHEMISVLQTLANLISGILQNTRLLESTQISFQETSIINRATWQIAQARNEAELVQYLTDTLTQMPLVSCVLDIEGEYFRVQVLIDTETGQVDKGPQKNRFSAGRVISRLTDNRTIIIKDTGESSQFGNIISLLHRRGSRSAALISVLENGKLSKVLVLGAKDMAYLSQSRLQPYQNLADIVGASLEKFSTFEQLQSRVSDLQTLTNFSQTISAETDLGQLFNVLHQQVIKMFGEGLEFAVALYNQKTNIIQFPFFYEQGQLITISPFPLGEGLTSVLIQSRKPLLLKNSQEVNSISGKVVGRNAKSWMGIPLIFSNIVIGAVLIQDLDQENRFTEDDVNLFMTLAPQIATSVRNAELNTHTQAVLMKQRLLRQVTITAASSTSIEDALIQVVRELYTGKIGDLIAILINDNGMLQVRASAGYEGKQTLEFDLAFRQGICSQAALEKKAICIDDTLLDQRYGILKSDMRSALAIPILNGDELVGILNLEKAGLAAFDENDIEILSALGTNLGAVISNIRLVDQIRRQVLRERQLYDAANKIRRSVDLETILETSAKEIARVAGAHRARIQITAGKSPQSELIINVPDLPDTKKNGHNNHDIRNNGGNGHHKEGWESKK